MVSMVVTFTLIASVVSVHCMSLLPKLWQPLMIICVSLQTSVVVNVVTERFAFGWRITLSIPILVSLVLVCGTIWLPETPR